MRLKLFDKGAAVTVAYGISESTEKDYDRTFVCIKEGEKIYKVLSLTASKKDGSLAVFFDYCKEKKVLVTRFKAIYKGGGEQLIDKSRVTGEFEMEFTADSTAKLSLHSSGFVQLSGNGIRSGIDPISGTPKGVGVFSLPLDRPVSSGPTFSLVCWGLDAGFELLDKQSRRDQHIILEQSDFEKRYINEHTDLNSYALEFFIFPKQANKFVYEHKGKPYINHLMHRYMHKPGALFAHPVLDIRFFDGVIALFPGRMWTGFKEKIECGYSLGSPAGTDSISDNSGNLFMFHAFCPAGRGMTLREQSEVKSLKFEN